MSTELTSDLAAQLRALPTVQIIGTVIFTVAVLHTFLAGRIARLSHRFREDSILGRGLHLLGEVEIVFGFWALVLLVVLLPLQGPDSVVAYVDSVNFTEAVFVFVIMAMAATRPILDAATATIGLVARIITAVTRIPLTLTFFSSILIIGPLLGSLITEPAAMTVVALLLKRFYYDHGISKRLKYAILGLLFVNISIGGVLTHFAAPPVLMVAAKYGWDTPFMIAHFGWKAAVAVAINTLATAIVFRKDILNAGNVRIGSEATRSPLWLILSHMAFMAIVVVYHNYVAFFVGVFLFFIGWTEMTKKYQDALNIRGSLLVGFFLAGLVTLGGLQEWWLRVVLAHLDHLVLFFGSASLTAVTDNAALTYLGSLVDLTDAAKYALVAGAVTGGGLTVIANAPNPAGYGLLHESFGENGISPFWLLVSALPATIVAACAFLFLPSF